MKWQFTIREKLMILYIFLGVFAVSMVGIYSFRSGRNAIVERSFQQLTSVREVKKARVENFFSDRERDVKVMGRYVSSRKVPDTKMTVSENIESIMSFFLDNQNYYSDMYILPINKTHTAYRFFCDGDNVSCTLATSYDSLDIAQSTLERIFSADSLIFLDYINCNNHCFLGIANPISFRSDSVDAYMLFGVTTDAVNEIMLEVGSFAGLGRSGESYLVGADKRMRSSSRFYDNAIMNIVVETDAVHAAIHSKTGTQIIKDYRGVSVLSSFSHLNVFGEKWAILSEIDLQEVMSPVYTIRNDIIIMSALIILVLCVVAFVFSRKITTPLLSLQAFALDIAKGTYGKTVQIQSTDEVGDLTQAFNHMSLQIFEQTKELREREKRLHHFYSATTDGIILHNRGDILLVSQAVCTMTSYTEKELMTLSVPEIIRVKNPDMYISHPSTSFVYETMCQHKNGSLFPVEVVENPIEYDGNIVSASVIRDISKRKEVEFHLQEERKKRISSFIDGQDNERKRLSRELHDGIGQSLVGIKMRLDTVRLENTPENIHVLQMIQSFVQQTILEVRRVSNNLIPSVLQDIGLKRALEKLCTETQKNSTMSIHLDTDMYTKINHDKIKTTIYRIVQETLHNAIKHSEAQEMNIMLIQETSRVRLIVEDDGQGFDAENMQRRGNGLYFMQERVSILGGTITISSELNKGTYIDVQIPLSQK
ncbi:MAG: histidine kinase [Bacteroidales bacterium]